jgi:hypothetical protein
MILVVFGAGASYDSVPSRPPAQYGRGHLQNRPPLGAELFLEDEAVFARNLRRFPQCHPIVPYLQADGSESIERRLELLQSEGKHDPERKRQIAAIRYYLHMAIWECEYSWSENVAHGITNYVTLLDQLRRSRPNGETVLLVSFNYDRMLERALTSVGVITNTLQDYISHDFKLFKVHGSVHWAREIDTKIDGIRERNVWDVANELIQRVADLNISERFRMNADDHPIGKFEDIPLFPAIAIPVETKSKCECPSDHLECLLGHLKKVSRILLIGWRASETHFITLLRNSLSSGVRIQVVSGTKEGAEQTLSRMIDAGVADSTQGIAVGGGFTEYAVSREAERFLG